MSRKPKFPYFAFLSIGGNTLAVAFEADHISDAWLTARQHISQKGDMVTSVTRLNRKDGRTAKWMESYSTPKLYPSQGA